MTYTPPPPPEMPSNRPSLTPPAAPAQAYQPVSTDLYASYAPASGAPQGPYSGYPPPPTPVPTTSGCRWGCIGTLLALFLVVGVTGALILSVLTSGANAFGGILSGPGNFIGSILGSWANAFQPSTRYIVLPEVERVQSLGELTTVKFNYAGFVTLKQDMPGLLAALYGNEQILVAVVSIRAGIDLKSITTKDIVYDKERNTLLFRLPAPALQECFMDDSKSYVVENRTGIFAGPSPVLDNEARRYAIQQFRNQALEEKILDEAKKEGETVLKDFMAVLNPASDAPSVEIFFNAPDPNAIPPVTCQ